MGELHSDSVVLNIDVIKCECGCLCNKCEYCKIIVSKHNERDGDGGKSGDVVAF